MDFQGPATCGLSRSYRHGIFPGRDDFLVADSPTTVAPAPLWRTLSALSNISSTSFSLLWLWLWLWIHGEASALLTLSHLAFPHLIFLSHITTSHSQRPGLMRFLVSRLVQIADSPVLASFLCCLAHLSFATSSGRSNLWAQS